MESESFKEELTRLLDAYLFPNHKKRRRIDQETVKTIQDDIESLYFGVGYTLKDIAKMCKCRNRWHNMLLKLKTHQF